MVICDGVGVVFCTQLPSELLLVRTTPLFVAFRTPRKQWHRGATKHVQQERNLSFLARGIITHLGFVTPGRDKQKNQGTTVELT